MAKTVKEFYENFDFERVITNPPQLIQEFLDGEIEFINKHIKPNKEILEIGCGYGRLLKLLSKSSERVWGIDFSRTLLKKAKENLKNYNNIGILEMNATNLKFNQESFDYCLCLDASFGNMPKIEIDVLREMKKVTKKGGEIIISVFSENAKDFQIKNYERIGLTNIQDDGIAVTTSEGMYSRRFSKEDLINLFRDIGMECNIIKICPINYIAIAKKD